MNVIFHRLILIISSLLILGCQTTSTTQQNPQSSGAKKDTLFHQDSTVYFADRTASVSMRPSFKNTINSNNDPQKPLIIQPLNNGYQLQFRTIRKNNIVLEKIDIIAGGKRIPISEGQVFIPANKGLRLSLSLENSLLINKDDKAILAFTFDGESFLVSIKYHRINEFTLP